MQPEHSFPVFYVLSIAAILIIAVVLAAIVLTVVRAIRRSCARLGDAADLVREMSSAAQEPQIRSVSGATELYLRQIRKDFPEFHAPEAETDVRLAVQDWLRIRYGVQESFSTAVGPLVCPPKDRNGVPADITFHRTVISGYHRSQDYATVTYQLSVGYRDPAVQETRFRAQYTLRLREAVPSKALKCPNCGASLQALGDRRCPYCDADIVVDTVMNWTVTEIVEE